MFILVSAQTSALVIFNHGMC